MVSRRAFVGSSLLLLAAPSPRPREILILRHAEKSGLRGDLHLNARGRARAEALPKLFPGRFAIPDFLFAAAPSDHSNRPAETIYPLARHLRLKIDDSFSEEDYRALARRLLSDHRYAGKVVLISWRHSEIPGLALALGVANAPKIWPENQFDRIWRIRYTRDGATFEDLPQDLLPGDAARTMM